MVVISKNDAENNLKRNIDHLIYGEGRTEKKDHQPSSSPQEGGLVSWSFSSPTFEQDKKQNSISANGDNVKRNKSQRCVNKNAATAKNKKAQDDPLYQAQPLVVLQPKKPSRPLSSYNLFFKDERKKILDEAQRNQGGDDQTPSNDGDKTKISFANLAKTIGTRWKSISSEKLEYYQNLAQKLKEQYKKEMNEYNTKFDLWLKARTEESSAKSAQHTTKNTSTSSATDSLPLVGADNMKIRGMSNNFSCDNPPTASFYQQGLEQMSLGFPLSTMSADLEGLPISERTYSSFNFPATSSQQRSILPMIDQNNAVVDSSNPNLVIGGTSSLGLGNLNPGELFRLLGQQQEDQQYDARNNTTIMGSEAGGASLGSIYQPPQSNYNQIIKNLTGVTLPAGSSNQALPSEMYNVVTELLSIEEQISALEVRLLLSKKP